MGSQTSLRQYAALTARYASLLAVAVRLASFLCELGHIIAKKDDPKDIRGGPYSKYFLVVHTDEAAIKEEVVRPWLVGFAATVGLLDEVLLLLSYAPEN
jgi:hypothetical protein